MPTRDQANNIHTVTLIAPVAARTDNTVIVSAIIDTFGYESCTLVIVNGTNTDADATFAVTLEHGDNSALSDSTVPATTDLVGTAALAGFTFADDTETRKIGYIGSKRYVRLTVTPAANAAGDIFISGVAVLGLPRNAPTSNPPQ